MKRITLLLLTLSLLTAVAAQDNDTSPTPQLLTGTLVNTKVNGGAAKLKLGDQGLGFYAVSGATQQNANTAYIAEKRTLLIDLATLDSPMTGIQTTDRAPESDKGTLHDLSGRPIDRSSALSKGSLYIEGGVKKMTIKKETE